MNFAQLQVPGWDSSHCLKNLKWVNSSDSTYLCLASTVFAVGTWKAGARSKRSLTCCLSTFWTATLKLGTAKYGKHKALLYLGLTRFLNSNTLANWAMKSDLIGSSRLAASLNKPNAWLPSVLLNLNSEMQVSDLRVLETMSRKKVHAMEWSMASSWTLSVLPNSVNLFLAFLNNLLPTSFVWPCFWAQFG